jgi:hypothetical protein
VIVAGVVSDHNTRMSPYWLIDLLSVVRCVRQSGTDQNNTSRLTDDDPTEHHTEDMLHANVDEQGGRGSYASTMTNKTWPCVV